MNSPESLILRELLAHEGSFVSGAALAKKLEVSRVAVWQHMEKLRVQGFEFEAVRARGYRLTAKPTDLTVALIRAYTPLRRRALTITVMDTVDSTNDEAARELATGRADPFVILAREQTQGRGRLGRRWLSEANGNLYASFAFRPQVAPERMQTFTLWMGVNICELVANFCRTRPGVKWPNDLLFDGKKAGGMLTEARIDSDQIRDLVFGLGLNLKTPRGGWPAELSARATALDQHTTSTFDVNKFAAALIGRVLLAYEKFVASEHAVALAEMWSKYDVLRGHRITALHGTEKKTGMASGIDDEGSLLLRTETGRLERLRAGEVTLERPPTA
ncbi:MAG TPA: biotin--[acetyl-CoA-carboxylase] ligase [Opitutaceae bacterium]|nr:biotin--[acetyl-CoA-carboxylase] ligase [Opitutaceae bacterium]